MPSSYTYTAAELPCSHQGGLTWIKTKLETAGYHMVLVHAVDADNFTVSVGEANVSKTQLTFDMQPAAAKLTCNITSVNVPPMSTLMATVGGPVGTPIKVRFDGIGFVSETEFVIPGNGNYEFQLGACPAGQRVITPQEFEFYVEDGSCSPVAALVTFS